MSEAAVLRELEDGVLRVTLNRPAKKNAFDDAQWDGLASALHDARADGRVAVALVTGAGRDFSAGQDLSAFARPAPPRADGFASGYHGCMAALAAFDKPLLAAARGVGVGIGATLLFHCDVVYVGESVRLRLPFVSLGLVPEAASSYLLQAMIGSRRAAELFYTLSGSMRSARSRPASRRRSSRTTRCCRRRSRRRARSRAGRSRPCARPSVR